MQVNIVVDHGFVRAHAGAKCDVLAALAKLLAENGKEIRAAALKSLEVAYEFQGEGAQGPKLCSHSSCKHAWVVLHRELPV